MRVPGGNPISGSTNLQDVEWALHKARRYIFRGGDPNDPDYLAYIDCWLDYRNQIAGTEMEHVGETRELQPRAALTAGDKT